MNNMCAKDTTQHIPKIVLYDSEDGKTIKYQKEKENL